MVQFAVVALSRPKMASMWTKKFKIYDLSGIEPGLVVLSASRDV
jgi:hypothetical protein